MLQVIARMLRPAPPVEIAAPARRPLYEGLTSSEYVQLIKDRIAARQDEDLEIRVEMVRVERVRARIAQMKKDTDERETIRSSRWVNDTDKKGK